MEIIPMILTAVFVLACLFLVLAPFFNWDSYLQTETAVQESTSDKEALLTTLNEIEFEHNMGKLSDSDYQNLKKQYEQEVVKIMKTDEQVVKTAVNAEVMADVEREIEAALKRNKKKEGGK